MNFAFLLESQEYWDYKNVGAEIAPYYKCSTIPPKELFMKYKHALFYYRLFLDDRNLKMPKPIYPRY